LEQINKHLAKAKHKSTYHKIQKALGDNRHFETDNKIFIIAHGVVYPLKKKHYSSTEEALDAAEEIERVIWNDSKLLEKFMSNQQSKLLEVLKKRSQLITTLSSIVWKLYMASLL
jgi:hypothetical protein